MYEHHNWEILILPNNTTIIVKKVFKRRDGITSNRSLLSKQAFPANCLLSHWFHEEMLYKKCRRIVLARYIPSFHHEIVIDIIKRFDKYKL